MFVFESSFDLLWNVLLSNCLSSLLTHPPNLPLLISRKYFCLLVTIRCKLSFLSASFSHSPRIDVTDSNRIFGTCLRSFLIAADFVSNLYDACFISCDALIRCFWNFQIIRMNASAFLINSFQIDYSDCFWTGRKCKIPMDLFATVFNYKNWESFLRDLAFIGSVSV